MSHPERPLYWFSDVRRGEHIDVDAARAHGSVFAVAMASEQEARGSRAVDLLIAAAALSADPPIYTRNGDDFGALDSLIDVVVV